MNKVLGFALVLSMFGAGAASAQNLVKNGDFENVSNANGVSQPAYDNYVIKSSSTPWGFALDNWTNNSFVGIVYGEGVGDSASHAPLLDPLSGRQSNCHSPEGERNCSWNLRGSNDGTPTGQGRIVPPSSPAGGNYYGSDPAYAGALTQSVEGFVVGQQYQLSFWSAGGTMQMGGSGQPAVTSWRVNLRGTTLDVDQLVTTEQYSNLGGTSPWVQTFITFTASSATELLSFQATGAFGSPPMSLLDGVSIVAVPEPAQWATLGGGLFLLAGLRLRRREQRR